MAAENFLQTNCVFLGLFEVFFETGSKLLVARGFNHFGQGPNNLLLCAIEVL